MWPTRGRVLDGAVTPSRLRGPDGTESRGGRGVTSQPASRPAGPGGPTRLASVTDHPQAIGEPGGVGDLELAGDLACRAGRLAQEMLRQGLDTHHKSSVSDVVSDADHAAEELIVRALRQGRPGDAIVGEEGTDQPGEPGRTWYLDPVDGTYNFLSGLPYWCSAIALADAGPGGGPVLGAVYHPPLDELWLGGPDHPTTRNGVPVEPLADAPLSRLSLASYLHPATLPDDDAREPLLTVLRAAATVRMLGSGSVELAAVAGGRLGLWAQIDTLDWDWLPGAALVLGAGGATEVLQHRGHRWHLAGNRLAVAEARALLLG